jgi:hypothetical protein
MIAVASSEAAVAIAETADAEDEQPEQQMLGVLAAAPAWAKVLDTGSGNVYHWNMETTEVLWEPPEGYYDPGLTRAAAVAGARQPVCQH